MKKFSCLVLALFLMLTPAALARADAASTSLFGYVIDMGGNTIELMTDDETPYTFTRDDATKVVPNGDVNIDDAIILKYDGTLNHSAEQQSVRVIEIDVLTVMYGTISDATMNTITVLSDDDGQNYTFGIENADILEGEDGILVNDQVELAFSGQLSASGSDSTIVPNYLHITVYGQADEDVE